MKSKIWMFILISVMTLLTACSNNDGGSAELKMLEVEFEVPKTAEVGETIELKAIVTYGGESVMEADTVKFEYWKKGKKDKSSMVKATNNGDGTYTAEVSFNHDGVYEMFAHTTAKQMHTMPKKSITVGKSSAGSGSQTGE